MAPPAQHYRRRGRPTEFDRLVELSKMAWAPVLELLGREIRFEDLEARPYQFNEPFAGWQETLKAEASGKVPRPEITWLTVDQVVRTHDEMIDAFGGAKGTIDKDKVASALDRARFSIVGGLDVFPTILHKAASILHDVLLYHPFVDGQKRTGISTAFIFLGLNGYLLWAREVVDEVHFAIAVAEGKFEVNDITRWLAARVIPTKYVNEKALVEEVLQLAKKEVKRCSRCGTRLRLETYLITCGKCHAKYRLQLNAGLISRTSKGPKLHFDVGLRIVDEESWKRTRLP